MCQNQCKVIKSENDIMKNKQMFLYFQYKENKIQLLINNFTGRPYYKKKDTSQEGYQEENTQTNVQGQPMKNIIRNITARKFNNKNNSYHSVSTQQSGQRPKKTQQPTKLTQQTPNLATKD
jgi:hypothetical protein